MCRRNGSLLDKYGAFHLMPSRDLSLSRSSLLVHAGVGFYFGIIEVSQEIWRDVVKISHYFPFFLRERSEIQVRISVLETRGGKPSRVLDPPLTRCHYAFVNLLSMPCWVSVSSNESFNYYSYSLYSIFQTECTHNPLPTQIFSWELFTPYQ